MTFVEKAKKTLNNGGVILYPTDTVYGLGVDAMNEEALKNLIELKKGRVEEKGFLVAVADLDMASQYVEVTDLARKLAEKFLPGPLTLILKSKNAFPRLLREGHGDTLAIRIPNNEFCLELSRAFGKPYVTTSANIRGEQVKKTIPEILEQFGEKAHMIDYVVDTGELPQGPPSTIVDISSGEIEIVRNGVIPSEEILRVDR